MSLMLTKSNSKKHIGFVIYNIKVCLLSLDARLALQNQNTHVRAIYHQISLEILEQYTVDCN